MIFVDLSRRREKGEKNTNNTSHANPKKCKYGHIDKSTYHDIATA